MYYHSSILLSNCQGGETKEEANLGRLHAVTTNADFESDGDNEPTGVLDLGQRAAT